MVRNVSRRELDAAVVVTSNGVALAARYWSATCRAARVADADFCLSAATHDVPETGDFRAEPNHVVDRHTLLRNPCVIDESAIGGI